MKSKSIRKKIIKVVGRSLAFVIFWNMNKLSIGRRLFASGRRLFSSNAPSTETLKLNFCTPHGIIYSGKSVEQLVLPGDDGEYGITVGHSSIISQLQPGVVSIVHTSVSEILTKFVIVFALCAM
jgi:hypothetical protein